MNVSKEEVQILHTKGTPQTTEERKEKTSKRDPQQELSKGKGKLFQLKFSEGEKDHFISTAYETSEMRTM